MLDLLIALLVTLVAALAVATVATSYAAALFPNGKIEAPAWAYCRVHAPPIGLVYPNGNTRARGLRGGTGVRGWTGCAKGAADARFADRAGCAGRKVVRAGRAGLPRSLTAYSNRVVKLRVKNSRPTSGLAPCDRPAARPGFYPIARSTQETCRLAHGAVVASAGGDLDHAIQDHGLAAGLADSPVEGGLQQGQGRGISDPAGSVTQVEPIAGAGVDLTSHVALSAQTKTAPRWGRLTMQTVCTRVPNTTPTQRRREGTPLRPPYRRGSLPAISLLPVSEGLSPDGWWTLRVVPVRSEFDGLPQRHGHLTQQRANAVEDGLLGDASASSKRGPDLSAATGCRSDPPALTLLSV